MLWNVDIYILDFLTLKKLSGNLPGIVSCASIVSFFWPFLHQLVFCPPLVNLAGALCHHPGLPEIFRRTGSHATSFKMSKSTGEGGIKIPS